MYFIYVLAAFNLAIKVRWPFGKSIGVLLAGTIPLLGIIVEHFQTKDVKARFALSANAIRKLQRAWAATARSAGSNELSARPRCDAASFSAEVSCAAVRSSPSGMNTGS